MSGAACVINVCEFCERFAYYGIRTILVIFLFIQLDYDENCSTILYHMFSMMVSIFPFVGAIITDKWIGKYEFILLTSILYSIGGVILVSGLIKDLNLPIGMTSFIGLLLIAIAAGGIRPCVSSFGSDQFKLPAEADNLAQFFTVFHITVTVASILATAIIPILRENYYCYGNRYCFPLAFTPLVILLIAVLVILAAANKMFVTKPPGEGELFNLGSCIVTAFGGWIKDRKTQPRGNFLDYAEPKMGTNAVNDGKVMLKILLLFLPLSFFWALFNQQGSRWTLQATRMDGYVYGYHIKPDQMQISNLLLLVALKPVITYIISPFLSLILLRRPLQKVAVGGFLAAFAFVMASHVESKLDACVKSLPENAARLVIFSSSPITYLFQLRTYNEDLEFNLTSTQMFDHIFEGNISAIEESMVLYGKISAEYDKCRYYSPFNLQLKQQETLCYHLAYDTLVRFDPRLDKPKLGYPWITTLVTTTKRIYLRDSHKIKYEIESGEAKSTSVKSGNVTIMYGDEVLDSFLVKKGGAYIVLGYDNDEGYEFRLFSVRTPCPVHMLLQLPQYIFITIAEIIFSISIMEFIFEEATKAIKSTLQVYWILMMALGDLWVVIIVNNNFAEKQSEEYLLFAKIMAILMLIFIILAILYKPTQQDSSNVVAPSRSEVRPAERESAAAAAPAGRGRRPSGRGRGRPTR